MSNTIAINRVFSPLIGHAIHVYFTEMKERMIVMDENVMDQETENLEDELEASDEENESDSIDHVEWAGFI